MQYFGSGGLVCIRWKTSCLLSDDRQHVIYLKRLLEERQPQIGALLLRNTVERLVVRAHHNPGVTASQLRIALQHLEHCLPVHSRHYQVQQNDCVIGRDAQDIERVFAVSHLHNRVSSSVQRKLQRVAD